MAGRSVGNLAIIISGNSAPLAGELRGAEKRLSQFGANAGTINQKVVNQFRGAGQQSGSAFAGGLIGGVGGALVGQGWPVRWSGR